MFTEDTNLFCAEKNINQLVTTVLNLLDKLSILFRKQAKCYLAISTDSMCAAKFLGVLIDEKLNWKDHITNVKSKVSKSIAILYKCSQVIDSVYAYPVQLIVFTIH